MFGNCATGRLAIVTAPTITMRMAITIATMGRLMKKLDMDLDSFRSNLGALRSLLRRERQGGGVRATPVLEATDTSLLFRRPCSRSLGHKWLGFDGRARAESLLALRDHTFTRLQSVLDNPHGANAFPNFDWSNGDLVVPPDNINLIAALQIGDSSLGDQ